MENKISKFTGKYRFLSNFYPCLVEFEGMIFPSVEHAFQAAKVLDLQERRKFRVYPTPADAKAFGRHVKLRPDWEQVKVKIMTDIVRDKFTRNKCRDDIRSLLLETGTSYIEEGNNHKDTFWGTVNGEGRNELGKILMQVREQLKEGEIKND